MAARVAEVAERVAELCVVCCVVERVVERACGWPCVLLVERVDRAAVRVIRRRAPGPRPIGWSGPWPIGWSEPRRIGWSDGGRGTECELRCLRLSVRVSAGGWVSTVCTAFTLPVCMATYVCMHAQQGSSYVFGWIATGGCQVLEP